MNKVLLILAVLSTFILSCTLSKDFVLKIDKTFNVNYSGTAYTAVEDVDAAEYSSDFKKYSGDLKSVDVLKGTYEIIAFTGSATQKINAADLKVGSTDGSTAVELASVANVLLSTALNHETSLSLQSAGKNRLETQILNDPHIARLYFSGTANENPVVFSIKFRFEVKVTYEKKII
jgi:hypothetical protein